MGKENRENLIKIIVSSILLLVSYMVVKLCPINDILTKLIYLIPYLVVSFESIKEVILNIFNKEEKFEIFDEDFLMVIASIGAFLIGEYTESIVVFILYSIGELFEDYAVDKSEKNIEDLINIRPDYCNVIKDGMLIRVSPYEISIGEIIYVLPAERVPMDGIVKEVIGINEAKLDTSSITGESKARFVKEDDLILSGVINISGNNKDILKLKEEELKIIDGTIKVEVTKVFTESTASKILELVSNAKENRADSEKFIDRFSRVYTPIVCALSLLLFLIPSFITRDYSTWLYRALTFLVISCPCALVISIPLTFFACLGAESRNGILVKGSNYLEMLSKVSIVAFDKTGTLTYGNVIKEDRIKESARDSVLALKKMGIRDTIMLTGDYKDIASKIGQTIGIDRVISELLPDGKLKEIEKLLKEKKKEDIVCYVGDGINDAPSLMKADLGIAMGQIGTDASIEASDIVIMDDDLLKIPKAITISRKGLRIVKENIILSLLVKLICLGLSGIGIVSMWVAILSDVGVMVLAVLNSLRALRG